MTDKRTIAGYIFWLSFLILISCFSLYFFTENNREILAGEDGLIEMATLLTYFISVFFILYKGRTPFLKKYYYFYLIVLSLTAREWDFDKRFTTMRIFKTKFFVSPDVPVTEKIFALIVIVFLLILFFYVLKKHFRSFLQDYKKKSPVSLGVIIIIMLAVGSQILDGLSKKLKYIGIEMGRNISMHTSLLEEVLELGMPIFIILTFNAYFKNYMTDKPIKKTEETGSPVPNSE